MSEYTPGPWRVGDDKNGECWIFIPGHDLYFGDMETTDLCCWANARLIAAAPDLLAAAIQASAVLAYCLAHGYIDSMATAEAEKATAGLDAAIAKATGAD